jgi:hypothetical protein
MHIYQEGNLSKGDMCMGDSLICRADMGMSKKQKQSEAGWADEGVMSSTRHEAWMWTAMDVSSGQWMWTMDVNAMDVSNGREAQWMWTTNKTHKNKKREREWDATI